MAVVVVVEWAEYCGFGSLAGCAKQGDSDDEEADLTEFGRVDNNLHERPLPANKD